MDSSAKRALDVMGIDVHEVTEYNERVKREKIRTDKRVCVCGHGMGQHRAHHGHMRCEVAKHLCDCQHPEAVLEVQDLRLFQFRTDGPSARHALARGIAESARREKEVRWIVDPMCQKCQVHDGRTVAPVKVSSERNVLLCEDCRASL